ncbi:MAG: hypothetical protein E7530_05885 [Ruminococcaceae bacterium]|nr:hypothetical protein [Oscillospiraceae bacterium]
MQKNILKIVLPIIFVVFTIFSLIAVVFVSQYTRFWNNDLNISKDNIEEIVEVLNQLDYTMPEGYSESEGESIYPTKEPIGEYYTSTDTYEIRVSKFSGKEMDKETFYSCSPCYFENHSDVLNGRYYKMIETGEYGNYHWISTPLEAYVDEDDVVPLYGLYYGEFCIQNGEEAYICQYSVCASTSVFWGLKPPELSAIELLQNT